jgi:hypothetical protein
MIPGKSKILSPKKSCQFNYRGRVGSSRLCDTKVDHSLFTEDSALKDDSVALALCDTLV